jgi:hypothetical protein
MQEEEVDAISNWEKKGLHFHSLVCVSEIKTPSVLFLWLMATTKKEWREYTFIVF